MLRTWAAIIVPLSLVLSACSRSGPRDEYREPVHAPLVGRIGNFCEAHYVSEKLPSSGDMLQWVDTEFRSLYRECAVLRVYLTRSKDDLAMFFTSPVGEDTAGGTAHRYQLCQMRRQELVNRGTTLALLSRCQGRVKVDALVDGVVTTKLDDGYFGAVKNQLKSEVEVDFHYNIVPGPAGPTLHLFVWPAQSKLRPDCRAIARNLVASIEGEARVETSLQPLFLLSGLFPCENPLIVRHLSSIPEMLKDRWSSCSAAREDGSLPSRYDEGGYTYGGLPDLPPIRRRDETPAHRRSGR